MRFPLRSTLLTSFLVLIVFLVVGQALVLNRGLKEEFIAVRERELEGELELAPDFLENFGPVSYDSAARAFASRIGYPVTFLNPEGRVVGASSDLPFQRQRVTVSLESPEMVAAQQPGDVGFDRRRGAEDIEIRLFAVTRIILGGEQLFLQVAMPLDEIEEAVRNRIWNSLSLFAPAVALSLAFTLLLGGAILGPLQTLGRRARGLAAGNFSRRIPRSFKIKELDEIAGTFNRLTEELQGRYRSLEAERDEMQALIDWMGEAVIGLTEDGKVLRTNRAAIDLLDFPDPVPFVPVGTLIRQPALRTLMENAVARPFAAREITLGDRNLIVSARRVEGGGAVVTFLEVTEIRRLEMVRRDFVANASHELKTPLTAMRGFAETLLEDDPPENLKRDFLGSIRSNTLRLQHLVDDLLDLSRLESGGWMAREEVVDLRSVVEDLWSGFRQRLSARDLAFSVDGNALVLADEQGVNQVIRNLVDNAIQYTPDGGSISVRIWGEGPLARIEVRDTGIGIPTAALPRIFERFFRVDPARSRAEGGTGLGLAIVRHLVEAMGGKVWAESELGQGTRIFVSLLRASEATEASEV
ncbi:MAG: ATP-binding protein [Gemmatimonadota bacterium]|jgi:signal transduction histidine kinase/HAMP domain-containing protein